MNKRRRFKAKDRRRQTARYRTGRFWHAPTPAEAGLHRRQRNLELLMISRALGIPPHIFMDYRRCVELVQMSGRMYRGNDLVTIIDDPYDAKPATEEQKEKIKQWYQVKLKRTQEHRP